MLSKRIDHFLQTLDRSPNTIKTYRQGLKLFQRVAGKNADLTIENYTTFLVSIKDMSPSSKKVYKTAVAMFYAFNKACDPFELKKITEHYIRKSKAPLPRFDQAAIEKFVEFCTKM